MKRNLLILLILLGAGAGVARFWFKDVTAKESPYQLAELRRGKLESTVTATGTLNALETVTIGTQVSGTISQVLVDFNDAVKKDQLLAVIDTELLDAALRDAQSEVQRMQAQLDQARSELKRFQPLANEGIISRNDLATYKTALLMAQANIVGAQSSLSRAEKNRKNAEIRSPIDGVVIQRTADVGQTVAASLQSPTLFIVAQDLAHMEILTNVDESDIGQIAVGQPVRFTAASFPDTVFEGVTRQVRLQPTTLQNVVNYTVVVEAQNPEGILLPGMTATVEIVVQKVEDVLLIPSSALSFRPSAEMLKSLRGKRSEAGKTGSTEASADRLATRGADREQQGSEDVKRLWYIDETGAPKSARVKAGATDGFTTEIQPLNDDIEAGTKIITGMTAKPSTASAGQTRSTSPFAQQGGQRGGGRGTRP